MQEFFWKKDLQSYQHLFLDMLMVFMAVLLKHSLVQPLVDYSGRVNLSSVDFIII